MRKHVNKYTLDTELADKELRRMKKGKYEVRTLEAMQLSRGHVCRNIIFSGSVYLPCGDGNYKKGRKKGEVSTLYPHPIIY